MEVSISPARPTSRSDQAGRDQVQAGEEAGDPVAAARGDGGGGHLVVAAGHLGAGSTAMSLAAWAMAR